MPCASLNGFRNSNPPAGIPVTKLSVICSSITGIIVKEASISSDWNTSVRDTARNPPTSVYDATAINVTTIPALGASPKISWSSFDPPTRPDEM